MNNKIDKVVLKETAYIATWTLIFSALLQAVFLILGIWHYNVLLGNLYSDAVVIFNFFMIGLTVQKAVSKPENDAKQFMKTTGSLRMVFLFVMTVIGVVISTKTGVFNIWSVVIPLFFPRAAIMLRPYFGKKLDAEIEAEYAQNKPSEPASTDEDTASDAEKANNTNNTEGETDNELGNN